MARRCAQSTNQYERPYPNLYQDCILGLGLGYYQLASQESEYDGDRAQADQLKARQAYRHLNQRFIQVGLEFSKVSLRCVVDQNPIQFLAEIFPC